MNAGLSEMAKWARRWSRRASKVDELSPSSLNHLRAYARRLYTVASVPRGRPRAVAAASAAEAVLPFAAPHLRDPAREGSHPPRGSAPDPSARRRRDDARHLHPRRPGRHARRTSRIFAANLLPDFSGGIEQLLTVRQVAELVGVCSATVYKWAAVGVLPHVRIVNVIRIRGEDLNRLLSARAPTPPVPPRPSR